MAEDTGDVLRRSLDAVDRHRRLLIAGFVVTVLLLIGTIAYGAHAVHNGGGGTQALLAHFALLLIWMALLTLVVVIQMTAMTKRILRAIELASKK